MNSISIYPPLAACLKFSFKLLFTVIVVVAVIQVGMGWLFGKEPSLKGFRNPAKLIVLLSALATGLGVAIYGIYRWSAATIDKAGIKGRSFWGRKLFFQWSEVESVRQTAVNGAPALIISSKSGKELWFYILGIDISSTYTALCQTIGPDHSFAQFFKP